MQGVASAAETLRKYGHETIASQMERTLIHELVSDNGLPANKPAPRTRNVEQPRKRMRKIDDKFLQKIAQAYVDAEPREKTAAVIRVAKCSPKSAGYYVRRAKEAGFLT